MFKSHAVTNGFAKIFAQIVENPGITKQDSVD
jgi:hypothetical protein